MDLKEEQQSNYRPKQEPHLPPKNVPEDKATQTLEDNKTPVINFGQTKSPSDKKPQASTQEVRWQSAEFNSDGKTGIWYAGIILVALVASGLIFFLLKDWSFSIIILVIAATIVIMYRRSPKMIQYTLTQKGIYIDDRLFPYEGFKSFVIIKSSSSSKITLIPRKRWEFGIDLSFTDAKGAEIVDFLAQILPAEQKKPDIFDKIMKKLNF